VIEELKKRGYDIERRRIGLRDHIKEIGDYEVTIKLHRDVTPTIKVKVRREGEAEEQAAATSATEAAEPTETTTETAAEATTETPVAEAFANEAESAQE